MPWVEEILLTGERVERRLEIVLATGVAGERAPAALP